MKPMIADLAADAAGRWMHVARSRPLWRTLLLSLVVLVAGGGASAAANDGWDHVGMPSLDRTVNALHPTSGGLYAGGTFVHAGGIATGNIARWDGAAWSALGATPLNGVVHAIADYAGKIYAGGAYRVGAAPLASQLSVWDGASWKPFCTGPGGKPIAGTVRALQVIGTTLYVGGAFQDGAGLRDADYLIACDLTTGAPRAIGVFNQPVYALTADTNGTLYAGGEFLDADGIKAADRVASYAGGVWQALGSAAGQNDGAVTAAVRSLATNGTDVFIGTDALDVAGIPNADHIAKWNGWSWSALGSNGAGTNGWIPGTNVSIDAIAAGGDVVFVLGSFSDVDGNPKADEVARFRNFPTLSAPAGWSAMGSNGAGDGPLVGGHGLALTFFGGRLIAGGAFTSGGGDTQAVGIAAASPEFWPGYSSLPTQIPRPPRVFPR